MWPVVKGHALFPHAQTRAYMHTNIFQTPSEAKRPPAGLLPPTPAVL